jgi:hypothetical protein
MIFELMIQKYIYHKTQQSHHIANPNRQPDISFFFFLSLFFFFFKLNKENGYRKEIVPTFNPKERKNEKS